MAKEVSSKMTEDGFIIIERLEEIPEFKDEAEEHEFWSKHTFSEELLGEMKSVPPEGDDELPPARTPVPSEQIAVRMESDILRRLKALAAKKGMSYQALLKTFVVERLYEEEKREGII
jgi:hypothetical protein